MIHKIVIRLRPESKKNKWRIRRNPKTGKRSIGTYGNVWETAAVQQVRAQWSPRQPIDHPVVLACWIYQGAGQHVDADGALTSGMDVLQAAGVLKNDYRVVGGMFWRERDTAEPRIVMEIAAADNGLRGLWCDYVGGPHDKK